MANNKVQVDVIIDDKGNLKKVAHDANKAGQGLDQAAKASNNYSKGQKGVAGATSNSTKAFSKMSGGMGGMVGAYASFAAQMFAVTAAFGYLKRAGDLAVLQQGQIAYTSATGVAMRTLANDITAATDAQITFRDASEAAAIGIASGLSPEQLTRLGTAARDASAVLGRDVTDSFNRLVRGVTKAEPELLDELGIILRLETANKNYAASLGILAKDLTQFQKSQAVANEVLTQSEAKYSAVLDAVGRPPANEFNKLAKSMDDLSMKIQKVLLPAANAFATTLMEVPLLAMGSFGLLLKGPLAAMGVSLNGVNVIAVKAKAEQQALYNAIELGAVKARLAVDRLKEAQMQKVENVAANSTSGSKTLQNVQGKTFATMSARDKKQIDKSLKELEGKYKAHEVITKGIFKGLKMSIVTEMQTGFAEIAIAEKALEVADTTTTNKMKLNWLGLKATVSAAAASTAKWAGRILAAAGWIGVAVTVISVLYELFKKDVPKTPAEDALERQAERIKSLTEDYEKLAAIQKAMYDSSKDKEGNTTDTGATWMAALGNQIGATGVSDNKLFLEQMTALAVKRDAGNIAQLEAKVKLAEAALKNVGEKDPSWKKNEAESALNLAKNTLSSAEQGYTANQLTMRGEAGVFSTAKNEAITDQEKNTRKYLQDTKSGIDSFIEATGSQNKAFLDYQAILQKVLDNPASVELKDLNKAQQDAAEMGKLVGQLGAMARDSSTAINSFFLGLAPLNEAESAMQKIGVEMAALEKINNAEGDNKLKAENAARIALLKEEQTLLKSINDAEHEAAQAKLANAEKSAVISRMANSVLRETAMADMKVVDARQEQTDLTQEQANLNKVIKRQAENQKSLAGEELAISKAATAAQTEASKILTLKLAAQATLIAYLEKEAALTRELEKVNLEIFNKKNDQRMLQMDQILLENMSKKVSMQQQMNTLVKAENDLKIQQALRAQRKSNPFAFLDQGKEEAAMNLQVAVSSKKSDEDAVEAERKMKLAQNVVEYNLLEMKYTLHALEMEKLKLEQAATANKLRAEAAGEKDQDVAGKLNAQAGVAENLSERAGRLHKSLNDMIAELPGMEAYAKTLIEKEASGKLAAITENISKLEEARDKVSDIGVLQDGIATSMQSNMESAFMSIVDGTKSAKQAFADMALAILGDIAQMITRMMVFRALSSMFGPTFLAPDAGMTDFAAMNDFSGVARQGGVFSAGKKVSGYATGGVARGPGAGYPALLHGTEAVVPLPNGRSIPVEMKNGSGSVNNIVVNVSNDGKTSTSGSSGPDMDKLGVAIAKAVQQELQSQKRSGGILNPYGVA